MRMLSFLQSEVCWVCYDGHTYKLCSEKEICSNFDVECLEVSFLKFETDLLHVLQLMKNATETLLTEKLFDCCLRHLSFVLIVVDLHAITCFKKWQEIALLGPNNL